MPAEEFASLLRVGDVYLDSIGWSGGNTTLEAITCDLPVVTMPGTLMRGRHSAAILTMMGLASEIAPTADAYVAKAVAWAEPGSRAEISARVRQQKYRIFGDLRPVRALEAFLEQEVGSRRVQPGGTRSSTETHSSKLVEVG